MPSHTPLLTPLLVGVSLASCAAHAPLEWSQLPPLPDAEGFASPFAGVSYGALIVGGGANIPEDKWTEVFTKVWYDSVFVLHPGALEWSTGPKLPRALGYGVSITADDSVLCFGGSDSTRHYPDSFRMQWVADKLEISPLPALPRPCANACGALLGRVIYIAGGTETPASTTALSSFWALDLDQLSQGWKELEPWPGPARMLSAAGVSGEAFYLFSGASLKAGPDAKPVRTYLKDAYRFHPKQGWSRISDLPRAAVAAPSPAPSSMGTLLILSGDDGANLDFRPLDRHPGFPRTVLAYDPTTDTWSKQGDIPLSRVTVPAVRWNKGFVLPNGEVRPRERTPQVWFAREKPEAAPPKK